MALTSSYTSWGRVLRPDHELLPLASRHAPLPALPGSCAHMLPYGNGRSYGDSNLNPGGALLPGRQLDRFIAFDPASGVLRCEAGVLLSEILRPLEKHADRAIVMSGLDMQNADARDGGGVHSRIQPCWLTGQHAKRTEGPDMQVGISMDQVAARAIGGETQLASLELALESSDLLGACDLGYTCAYTATLFACHPPGSAAYRIVARLQLVDATGAPVPPPALTVPPVTIPRV